MEKVIQNIIEAKPKRVIHFEFVDRFATKLARNYFDAMDYQKNLLPILESYKIIKIEPLNIGTPLNPLTYIEWKQG